MDLITCEIRFTEDESRQTPGRLVGVLMTYGEVASDRKEMFDPGALYFPPNGLLVNEQHQRGQPILRTSPTVDGKMVLIDAPFPDTQRGRDAATNLREGVLTGLSVEFHAQKETVRNGIRVIQKRIAPRYWGLSAQEYYDAADSWPLDPNGNMLLMGIIEESES